MDRTASGFKPEVKGFLPHSLIRGDNRRYRVLADAEATISGRRIGVTGAHNDLAERNAATYCLNCSFSIVHVLNPSVAASRAGESALRSASART